MQLDLMTWQEVADHLHRDRGILIPTGSTEQHGPMGLIGTDAICAHEIARRAADHANAITAPPVAFTPAPFNLLFPGTISVTAELFQDLIRQMVESLHQQGFRRFYVLNGHGANLAPLNRLSKARGDMQIKSWWDFPTVNDLRQDYYGEWEGMHATPSEIAITQALHRVIPPGDATEPPRRLTPEFIRAHAGDKHGPPEEHRREFPDGRVGSHSALARPEHGEELIAAAAQAVASDYLSFTAQENG